ncbi:armadillo-type protein [Lyophyllum atratum]|nr:armadillo-type protein [Lyophyllum atratum]
MPRENRKRGKKNKKKPDEEAGFLDDQRVLPTAAEREPLASAGEPSWIRSAPEDVPEINPEAPFGYVDADVKAYFRTVDVQMRNWQEHNGTELDQDRDTDPNEERRLFFMAALTEMGGKEKQLATDPDCSVILERMAYSMDDFVRRVFVDSLTGSFDVLVRHRFASHVCQTLFTVARDTISRESRGIFPTIPESSEQGELRTLTQLILDASEEILPTFASLIMDPFASHVVRAFLALLSPNLLPADSSTQSALRSKKSSAWKAKQGPMKSGKGSEALGISMPAEFRQLARRFVDVLRTELGENEVRALAADKVASPGLQMLLEVEADQGLASDSDSLMDRVMVGIVTACRNAPNPTVEPSDYLNTLLRDPTSSHLLETIVSRSPADAFTVLWTTYFRGKLARLAIHPVANFVLAKTLERTSVDQLSEVCAELDGSWSKMIRTSRTGVLRAVIDRGAALQASEPGICNAVYSAFDLVTPEDRALLVPCVLHLLPLQEYKAALAAQPASTPQHIPSKRHGRQGAPSDMMEPKVQGSILLQSLLRLSDPHNQIVVANIACLPIEERIKISHDASGSRVYDVLLDSPTVASKSKREFVMGFIGHYHVLVDDRLGSRVGDRCWAFADTYLKEKIGRSLFVHEQFLAGSYYGKFFARNLNLYLLQRRPDEWKTMQADRKRALDKAQEAPPAPIPTPADSHIPHKSSKRKRHTQPEDEIDVVFNASLGKRIKKAALGGVVSDIPRTPGEKISKTEPDTADGLQAVLGAIKHAPKDEKSHEKRKRH